MFKISKSDYVLGIKCPNALWFKKYRKELQPAMSYAGLGIHNGTEASDLFMAFMTGRQTPTQTAAMMDNLREYCGQDTMTMVRLLDVVQGFLKK